MVTYLWRSFRHPHGLLVRDVTALGPYLPHGSAQGVKFCLRGIRDEEDMEVRRDVLVML